MSRFPIAFTAALGIVCASAPAQMQMDPNMKMDAPPPAAPARKAPQKMPAPRSETTRQEAQPTARQAPQPTPQQAPTVPFGRNADGSSNDQPLLAPLPQTAVPLRLDGNVQEQEHPQRRSGLAETPIPNALADVQGREPQPLAFFTAKALAANPTLRQAQAQVLRLRAAAKQEGLWANPEVGYEADHIRGGSYHSGEQGGYVQQTIPLAGQRSTARAAVSQEALQAERALAEQRARVQSAVAQAFYTALAAQQEVALRGQLAQTGADAADTAHGLANVGQADAPDVLQSEVEREQAKLDYAAAQRAFRKAFAMLAAESGDAALPVAPLEGDLSAFPQLAVDTAQAAADGSPQLQTARQGIVASEAAVRSVSRQQMPELVLRAGLQQDNEPLSNTTRVGVVGVAQAGVSLPLWNRNQGATEAARSAVAGAHAEFDRRQLALRLRAQEAEQDYQVAALEAQRYRDELLPRALRAFQLYQNKYEQMAAAYPQVLVSQRVYLQLRIQYVQALNRAWQSAILLQNGLLEDGLARPETIEATSSRQ